MKKLTKAQIEKISKTKLDYKKTAMFLHCRHCLADKMAGKFGKGESPAEAMAYELGGYSFKYPMPDMPSARILVVWCKRCKRQVWDSRHLTNLY